MVTFMTALKTASYMPQDAFIVVAPGLLSARGVKRRVAPYYGYACPALKAENLGLFLAGYEAFFIRLNSRENGETSARQAECET